MKSILYLLFISFVFNLTPTQAQLLTVQNIELPVAYETWPGGLEKLILRTDLVLVAEKERRVLLDKSQSGTGKSLQINKINAEIVHVMIMENYNDQLHVTLYFLTKEGYVKLSGGVEPTKELLAQIGDIWSTWDKYIRERYNISDKEMREIERFLEL